jgi:hypothetical protein
MAVKNALIANQFMLRRMVKKEAYRDTSVLTVKEIFPPKEDLKD